jgi:uncharacterized membrane protein
MAAAGLMAGCGSLPGTNTAAASGETTDLVHCYGVNKCAGHNDCATSSNSCAGQASCKGTGFVAVSAKACGDIGGKSGA